MQRSKGAGGVASLHYPNQKKYRLTSSQRPPAGRAREDFHVTAKKKAIALSKEPPLPAPGPSERAAIDAARQSVKQRQPRVRLTFEQDGKGNVELSGGGHSDFQGWHVRLQDVFGSRGNDFATSQLNHLMTAARDHTGKIDPVRVNSMLAMVEGLRPANELQAALAVQAAVTHVAALFITQRAMRVDQIPQFDSSANIAVKLLRTFTLQAEALAKLQRGGEQVVKVVHVHPGAQAVVGNVINGPGTATGANGREGGATLESGNQPHAPRIERTASTEVLPPLRSPDTEREAMPVAVR
ncbi:MAG: hypothetical protein ACKVP7_07855 [Hyphomicrobiaceae bacterium]